MSRVRARGEAWPNYKTPPSPSRPPKVFKPVFPANLRIWGEIVGAKGAENFFLPS